MSMLPDIDQKARHYPECFKILIYSVGWFSEQEILEETD